MVLRTILVACYQFTFPVSEEEGFLFSTASAAFTLMFVECLTMAILTVRADIPCGFDLHFLNIQRCGRVSCEFLLKDLSYLYYLALWTPAWFWILSRWPPLGDFLKAIVFFFTYSILDLVIMNSKCPSVQSLSCVRLLATPWIAAYQAPLSMDFPGKSTGVGCHEGCSFSFIEAFPGCANAFKLCEVLSSDFWFLCKDSKPWIPKELATIFAHPCPDCFFFFSLGIS